MSLRISTPPPFRPPTILDAVSTPSHEHRRLYLEHVRTSEKVRAAQWKAASDVTLSSVGGIIVVADRFLIHSVYNSLQSYRFQSYRFGGY